VVLFSALGGFIIKVIMEGIKFPWCKIKPCIRNKDIKIPPLVGMLLFGVFARNFFGDYVKDYYPLVMAEWARKICLCVILLKGGLKLKFNKSLGKIVAY
jgi:predicted Kef-type K+ transport protein